jgi:hypothetical protein
VKCFASESTSLAWVWHIQIPFAWCRRCSELNDASYRGPPSSAAVICAATPTLTTPSSLGAAATVKQRQSGLEQRYPTRFAIKSFVA